MRNQIIVVLGLFVAIAASYLVSDVSAGDRAVSPPAPAVAPAAAPAAPEAEPTVLFKRTRTITETPVAQSGPVCRDGSCSPVQRLREATQRTTRTVTERRSRRGGGLFSRLFQRRSLGCGG